MVPRHLVVLDENVFNFTAAYRKLLLKSHAPNISLFVTSRKIFYLNYRIAFCDISFSGCLLFTSDRVSCTHNI